MNIRLSFSDITRLIVLIAFSLVFLQFVGLTPASPERYLTALLVLLSLGLGVLIGQKDKSDS
ncbi:hypothetical protein [Alteromonas halophila]|uniref:Uncharacterized protein n=1 Tax=Alteromonas halophila TaxID=516698 RepID=A0A918JHI1_9ALTE|nr:hypothetical protein [Alteromonas halophila]GGW81748.1 hypothetical protein GCM10007391_13710 [Alteromonas halophila]